MKYLSLTGEEEAKKLDNKVDETSTALAVGVLCFLKCIFLYYKHKLLLSLRIVNIKSNSFYIILVKEGSYV